LFLYGLIAFKQSMNKAKTKSENIVLGYKLRTIFQAFVDRGPAELHQFCMRLTEHDVDALKSAYAVMSAEMFKTMATTSPKWYKMRSGTRLISKRNGQHFDLEDRDPLEPWAGGEHWKNPHGTQEQALIRLADLQSQIAEWHKPNMPKEEFLELCKKRMNLSPRTTEALLQVVDIHNHGLAVTDDINAVAIAFQHPCVRRYCQEFVGVKSETLSRVEEVQHYEEGSEDLKDTPARSQEDTGPKNATGDSSIVNRTVVVKEPQSSAILALGSQFDDPHTQSSTVLSPDDGKILFALDDCELLDGEYKTQETLLIL